MKNLIPKRVMEYIIITFAVVLMDVGLYVFKFPNNFSFGGVSGMAVVFSHFIPMTSAQICVRLNTSGKLSKLGFIRSATVEGKKITTIHEETLAISADNLKKTLIEPGYISLADAGL